MASTSIIKEEEKAEKKYKRTHRNLYKLKTGDIVFNIINYAFFAIFTFATFFPFYYIFINTISKSENVARGLVTFWPRGFSLDSYIQVFKLGDMGQAFLITILRTVIGTALMVVSSGIVGYLVTKKEMWKRTLWYRLLVSTMYFNAGIIPWYMNMDMLGLTNNFLAYIIPAIVAPYNIILVKTYVESIPGELEESAFIDGANYMQIFIKIIWPLSKPILATITIFGAVGSWNSFQDSYILMKSNSQLWTLQHRLYDYLQYASNLGKSISNGGTVTAAAAAALENISVLKYTVSMVSILPILIVYPFMQRYFEEGIMLGAVKG